MFVVVHGVLCLKICVIVSDMKNKMKKDKWTYSFMLSVLNTCWTDAYLFT